MHVISEIPHKPISNKAEGFSAPGTRYSGEQKVRNFFLWLLVWEFQIHHPNKESACGDPGEKKAEDSVVMLDTGWRDPRTDN